MKIKNLIILSIAAIAMIFASSCKDSKSYSELLDEEQKAVNSYLANQRVVDHLVTNEAGDTIFEVGENAPFYKIDDNGDVYMQVIKEGDRVNNRAKDGDLIYFRFGRISIKRYEAGYDDIPSGNYGDMTAEWTSFRFYDDEYQTNPYSGAYYSYDYGYGIEMPLRFLGVDCEVNLLVKSQKGPNSEISSVVPYLYTIRYFRNKN